MVIKELVEAELRAVGGTLWRQLSNDFYAIHDGKSIKLMKNLDALSIRLEALSIVMMRSLSNPLTVAHARLYWSREEVKFTLKV